MRNLLAACTALLIGISITIISAIALHADTPENSYQITLEDIAYETGMYDFYCPPGCDCTFPNYATGPCTSGKPVCVGQNQNNCTSAYHIKEGWPTGCQDAIISDGSFDYYVFVNCGEKNEDCWQTETCKWVGTCIVNDQIPKGQIVKEKQKYVQPCF